MSRNYCHNLLFTTNRFKSILLCTLDSKTMWSHMSHGCSHVHVEMKLSYVIQFILLFLKISFSFQSAMNKLLFAVG